MKIPMVKFIEVEVPLRKVIRWGNIIIWPINIILWTLIAFNWPW